MLHVLCTSSAASVAGNATTSVPSVAASTTSSDNSGLNRLTPLALHDESLICVKRGGAVVAIRHILRADLFSYHTCRLERISLAVPVDERSGMKL